LLKKGSKKGSKRDVSNYRPVSLTCHAGKVLERIIKVEIMTYLENNKLIYNSQRLNMVLGTISHA